MKKVAIMTLFYSSENYGQILQVTALSYIIRKIGYQPEVINYISHQKVIRREDYINPLFYLKAIKGVFNIVVNIFHKLNYIRDEQREIAFQSFKNKYLMLSCSCQTSSQLFSLNKEFDAFICGSDQIWSPTEFDPKYYLDFVENPDKIIAYAPSVGVHTLNDIYIRKRMKKLIIRFKHLSIREEDGRKVIKEITGRDAEVVLDPVLLLEPEEWNKMANEQEQSNPYILCYFLGNNKLSWEHVKVLSRKLRFSVKVIPRFEFDLHRGYETLLGSGPAEFLGLIKNAAFVCTDSFHGVLFSIIYKKPFYVYTRFSNKDPNSRNSRIYNILRLTGLEGRLVKNYKVVDNPLECNFEETEFHLKTLKKKSLQYLKNALEVSFRSNRAVEYTIPAPTNTCSGCSVCAAICRNKAIDIKRDESGFLKAFIRQENCIKCDLCLEVCSFNGISATEIDKNKHKLFMSYSKSKDVLKKSSSGGIAYEISKLLNEQNYDIIGCTYDKKKSEALHKRIKTGEIDKLHIFQGSKYLQSDIEEITKEIANNTGGKAVIFGTPCQIAGIDRLLKLKNERSNYILVDLICHGVPTQNLWKKYIKEGARKYSYGEAPEVFFRYKPKGWREYYIRISGNGKLYTQHMKKDLFYRFFFSDFCLMSACYECNYRTTSAADVRIGDYWGPRFKTNKDGISMVIAITQTGENLLQELLRSGRIVLQQMDFDDYQKFQNILNPIKPIFYEELLQDLRNDQISLNAIFDKYCKGFGYYHRISLIYAIIKRIIKKFHIIIK